jgi:hypothetical protein
MYNGSNPSFIQESFFKSLMLYLLFGSFSSIFTIKFLSPSEIVRFPSKFSLKTFKGLNILAILDSFYYADTLSTEWKFIKSHTIDCHP